MQLFCISSKKQPVFESVALSETAIQTTTVLWKKIYQYVLATLWTICILGQIQPYFQKQSFADNLQNRCLIAKFLGTAFFIEHLRLCTFNNYNVNFSACFGEFAHYEQFQFF